MNGLYRLYFLFTLLISAQMAMAHDELPSPDITGRILGSYQGDVYSEAGLKPVITSFQRNDVGQIVGQYAIGGDQHLHIGKLSNFRIVGPAFALMDWEDQDGHGVLRLLFSDNNQVFFGFWGKNDQGAFFPWNGIREQAPKISQR